MATLSLNVVAASVEELWAYDLAMLRFDEVTLVANHAKRLGGYGALGQRLLDSCRSDVFGLVHADVALSPAVLLSLTDAAYAGCVAGIVGRTLRRQYVWSRDVEPTTVRPVSTLDSCSMFVSVKTVREHRLAFDARNFDDFHLCVEDFCLTAASRGVPVVVPSGQAAHAGTMYGDAAWSADWKTYKARLDEKWRGTRFATT